MDISASFALYSPYFKVALDNGDGTFQAPIVNEFPGAPLASADLNGDGLDDLILNFNGTALLAALSKGDGTFRKPVEVPYEASSGALIFIPGLSVYNDASLGNGTVYGYSSTTDIRTNLGSCNHYDYDTTSTLVGPDNRTVMSQEYGQSNNVSTSIADVFGDYLMGGTATANCSCAGTFGGGGPQASMPVEPPAINSGGVVIYPSVGAPISSVEIGSTGVFVLYGIYLTDSGYSPNPLVNVSNGIRITGYQYVSDGQINASYDATSATPGSATVSVTNMVATSNVVTVSVGDLAPVISGISASSFVVGVPATGVVISAQHLGTNCPNLVFPFALQSSYVTSSCTDVSITVGFTAAAAGSGSIVLTAEGYGGLGFDPQHAGESQKANSPQVTATNPAAAIVAVVPALGMAGSQQPIAIAGSNFGTAAPTITSTGNVTVTNISKPSGANGTGVTATLGIPASSQGGNVTITLTPTTGNPAPAQIGFFVQIPTTLIRATYSPGAPGGYGPLMTPVNTPILNAAGQVEGAPASCGVYRDLAYSVLDQENPAKVNPGSVRRNRH